MIYTKLWIRQASIIIICILTASCSWVKPERRIDENNCFFSTYNPDVQITFAPDINYIGEIKFKSTVNALTDAVKFDTKNEFYLFAAEDQNKNITRGVLIYIRETIGLFNMYAASGFPWSHMLEKKFVKIKGKEYKETITLDPDIVHLIKTVYADKSYNLSDCILVRMIHRLMTAKKTSITIYYFEDFQNMTQMVPACQNPDKLMHLLRFEKKYLDQFTKRSQHGYTIVN